MKKKDRSKTRNHRHLPPDERSPDERCGIENRYPNRIGMDELDDFRQYLATHEWTLLEPTGAQLISIIRDGCHLKLLRDDKRKQNWCQRGMMVQIYKYRWWQQWGDPEKIWV